MLIMEYLGLTEMFDFIATGDRYLPKPDADMLQAFCQSCQLKPTEVIWWGFARGCFHGNLSWQSRNWCFNRQLPVN